MHACVWWDMYALCRHVCIHVHMHEHTDLIVRSLSSLSLRVMAIMITITTTILDHYMLTSMQTMYADMYACRCICRHVCMQTCRHAGVYVCISSHFGSKPFVSLSALALHADREHMVLKHLPNDDLDDVEHADVGAAEHPELCHAASKAYVRATVDSAWTTVMDGPPVSKCRPNLDLISLSEIQSHIAMVTYAPVTMDMLLNAKPQHNKQLKRSWWSNIESISRCVAVYHNAFVASEHYKIELIQRDICGYAYILRRGLPSHVDVTEFFPLLLRAIANRSMNMALRTTIDHSLAHALHVGPCGRPVTTSGRKALGDILEVCLDIVKVDYEKLGIELREFREL